MQFRELGVSPRNPSLRTTADTSIQATSISQLVRLPGIIISASVLSSRAIRLHITCKSCRHVSHMEVQGGFSGFSLPRKCGSDPEPGGGSKDCPLDPYVIVHDKCSFVDQQSIKLQEAPDMVPVGELPRHVLLSADRFVPFSHFEIVCSTLDSQIFDWESRSGNSCHRHWYLLDLSERQEWSKSSLSLLSTISDFDFRCRKEPPSLYERPIYVSSDLRSIPTELDEERETSPPKRKKSLEKWLEGMDSTNASPPVSRRVSLETLVGLIVPFLDTN